MDNELLHNIDKRLAVLEALSQRHAKETSLEMHDVARSLHKIEKDLDKLKIKVAGISGITSIIVGVVFKWYSGL